MTRFLRRSALVREEMADLKVVLDGLPADLDSMFVLPYQERYRALKAELVASEASEYATETRASVQQLRVVGGNPSTTLPARVVATILGAWQRLYVSCGKAIRTATGGEPVEEDAEDELFVHASLAASYVLRVSSHGSTSLAQFNLLQALLDSNLSQEAMREQLHVHRIDTVPLRQLLGCIRNSDRQYEFQMFDPAAQLECSYVYLDSQAAAHLTSKLEDVLVSTRCVQFEHATFVGVSIPRALIEFRDREGARYTAKTTTPETLAGLTIGRAYTISVEVKTITHTLEDSEDTALTITSIAPAPTPQVGDAILNVDAEPYVGMVPSHMVPQADRLDRLHAYLVALLEGPPVHPNQIGINHPRAMKYYPDAAKLLKLCTDGPSLTRAGRLAAGKEYLDFLDFICSHFEESDVGSAWLGWAQVPTIRHLDAQSALEFLTARSIGLNENTRRKRAATLRKWVTELQTAAGASVNR